MYVLIIAFVTASAGQQYPGFAMQEFASMQTCQAALEAARQMSASLANTNREIFLAECRKK